MTTQRPAGSDSPRSAGGPPGGRPGGAQAGGAPRGGRRPWGRRKVCVFCAEKIEPEYKSVNRLRRFLSDRARIESGKKTGTCARHQRLVRREIKRARFMSLLPFTGDHLRITGIAAVQGTRPEGEDEEAEERPEGEQGPGGDTSEDQRRQSDDSGDQDSDSGDSDADDESTDAASDVEPAEERNE